MNNSFLDLDIFQEKVDKGRQLLAQKILLVLENCFAIIVEVLTKEFTVLVQKGRS
jgi:hypothetical protein